MTREFDVCGLGNALVDILLELTDEEFAALAFEKGTMRLVEPHEQRVLLEQFGDHEPRLVSGGSVANSVIACSQLGGKGRSSGASATTGTGCTTSRSSSNCRSSSAPSRSSARRPGRA